MSIISNGFGFGLGILILIMILIIGIVILLLKIIEIIGKWKLYKKAGKNGWEAIIPFYSEWVLIEISECSWWFFLLMFANNLTLGISYSINNTKIAYGYQSIILSLVSLISYYCVNYNISKKFDKDYFYAIGLTFLPFIFYPILGFSKENINKKKKVSPYGVFKEGEIKK